MPDKQSSREWIAMTVCTVLNGDEPSCKATYCANCGFKLPRIKETTDSILSHLRDEIGKVENPHIDHVHLDAGIYEGLKREAVEDFRKAILKLLEEE